jgi:pyrroline-5-carboxylate reductase
MNEIAFIGGGRMAEALISGVLAKGAVEPERIVVTDVDPARRDHLARTYGVRSSGDNGGAAREASFVVLAVKPQQIDEVVAGLSGHLTEDKVVVSIAAGVTVSRLKRLIGLEAPVVRVMPNAPAFVNAGMSAIVLPPNLASVQTDFIDRLFGAVGDVVHVEESDINAVTAISGSGPAYFFLFVKELASAGKEMGLTAETADRLARETFFGSARLLKESEASEDELIRGVASPGGTTEAALARFAEAGLGEVVRRAAKAALTRAKELE